MKLRNKKTGEIFDALIREKGGGGSYSLIVCDIKAYETSKSTLDETHFILDEYETLAELNEDWEDYKPAEPLIKDEKIRKAVRAWANSFNDVDEIKASDDYKEFWIDGYLIEFERPFDEVESEHTYRRTNIIELCGKPVGRVSSKSRPTGGEE